MSEKINANKITRRNLLKMLGVGAGAGLVEGVQAPLRKAGRVSSWLQAVSADPQAEFDGRLFRGSVDGCIFVSGDGGKSWELLTRLHDECAVTALQASKRGLSATLEFQGYQFSLFSPDGRLWRNG